MAGGGSGSVPEGWRREGETQVLGKCLTDALGSAALGDFYFNYVNFPERHEKLSQYCFALVKIYGSSIMFASKLR